MNATFEALQQAYQSDRAGFECFVAGILAAGGSLQERIPEAISLPAPAATLDQVLALYERTSTITRHSVKNNIGCLKLIVRRVLGEEDPAKVPLTALTKGLLFRYQEMVVAEYSPGIDDPIARREATTKALRSSKSVIRQARSIFSGRNVDFISRYESEGLIMPPNITEFLRCKIRGEVQRKSYSTPDNPEQVFERIFQAIEAKRSYDPGLFLALWMIAAFGLRQRELKDATWEHITERDGVLFYHGGCGKNGNVILVPSQERGAAIIREFRKPSGRIVDARAGRRLNFFLRSHGLTMTQKAAHEIRAWIGARIFEQQPRAAQSWLRHSSLTITEAAYAARYAKPPTVPNVL
jgi:integrase